MPTSRRRHGKTTPCSVRQSPILRWNGNLTHRVCYHSASAHSVQAVLIEVVTGQDYRQFMRDHLLQPLGLHGAWIGVPDDLHDRPVGAYQRTASGAHESLPDRNTPAFWRAGVPGGGGYATAIDMVTFYQMLLHLGALNGTRILGPRTVQYVTRNRTGDRLDERLGLPMHRGLGVHVRRTTPTIRGLGVRLHPTPLAMVARGPRTPGQTQRRGCHLPT